MLSIESRARKAYFVLEIDFEDLELVHCQLLTYVFEV